MRNLIFSMPPAQNPLQVVLNLDLRELLKVIYPVVAVDFFRRRLPLLALR